MKYYTMKEVLTKYEVTKRQLALAVVNRLIEVFPVGSGKQFLKVDIQQQFQPKGVHNCIRSKKIALPKRRWTNIECGHNGKATKSIAF